MIAAPDKRILRSVKIVNQRGLHARAAAKFVKLAERFDAEISVRKRDTLVTGTSIMGLMMLAAGPGTSLDLLVSGPEAETAAEALSTLIANRFDEDA